MSVSGRRSMHNCETPDEYYAQFEEDDPKRDDGPNLLDLDEEDDTKDSTMGLRMYPNLEINQTDSIGDRVDETIERWPWPFQLILVAAVVLLLYVLLWLAAPQ